MLFDLSGCGSSNSSVPDNGADSLSGVIGIGYGSFSRADCVALRFIEESNTLGAFRGVDHVFFIAFADGVIGAFRFASATGYTFVSNFIGHLILR